jgi:P27 family predicted phage terminase small subunit
MARPALSEDYHRVVGTRATRANVEPSPHISGRPTRPSHLSEIGRKEWNRIIKILTERGTLTKGDGPVIELYVSTYCDWRAFNAEVEAKGRVVDSVWKDDTGEHSSRIANPILKNVAQTANLNPKMKEFPVGSAGWLRAQQKKATESASASEQEEILL